MLKRRPGIATKLFVDDEISLIDDKRRSDESIAARFAAKEALAKALGAPSGLRWSDVNVAVDESGQPSFVIRGTVASRAEQLGITKIHLSISHDAGIAAAFVVCERES